MKNLTELKQSVHDIIVCIIVYNYRTKEETVYYDSFVEVKKIEKVSLFQWLQGSKYFIATEYETFEVKV